MSASFRPARRIGTCPSGVAALEFALILPVMIVIFMGVVELARMAIIHQKLDKTITTINDLVTRGETVRSADLDTLGAAVNKLLDPYELADNDSLVFSSVSTFGAGAPCTIGGVQCVTWQHVARGSNASRIGGPGGTAALPNGYVLQNNQNVIVTEMTYQYTPIIPTVTNFIPALAPRTIYKVAMFKPRLGALTTLDPVAAPAP